MNEFEESKLEESARLAFRRIFDQTTLILDGEEPNIAFCTMLSLVCVTGYEAGFNVPQMKDQLQHLLKRYAEFFEKKLKGEKK